MAPDHSASDPYRVLVPISDNETSAQAQARFVASLPNAPTSVEATLTHVLHGEELSAPRDLRTAQRVGTVVHARDYLRDHDVAVQITDADDPHPPTKSILDLADSIDADQIVLGGGMHGFIEDLVTGQRHEVSRKADTPSNYGRFGGVRRGRN